VTKCSFFLCLPHCSEVLIRECHQLLFPIHGLCIKSRTGRRSTCFLSRNWRLSSGIAILFQYCNHLPLYQKPWPKRSHWSHWFIHHRASVVISRCSLSTGNLEALPNRKQCSGTCSEALILRLTNSYYTPLCDTYSLSLCVASYSHLLLLSHSRLNLDHHLSLNSSPFPCFSLFLRWYPSIQGLNHHL